MSLTESHPQKKVRWLSRGKAFYFLALISFASACAFDEEVNPVSSGYAMWVTDTLSPVLLVLSIAFGIVAPFFSRQPWPERIAVIVLSIAALPFLMFFIGLAISGLPEQD